MVIGPFHLPKFFRIHVSIVENLLSSVSSEVEQEGPFDLLGLGLSTLHNPKGPRSEGGFVAAKLGRLGWAM